MNSVEYLMQSMVEAAEKQIEAAKTLKPEELQIATEHRQDLLFQLEIERKNGEIQVTDTLLELSSQLRAADDRLMALLKTVSDAALQAGIGKKTTVYNARGKLHR
ncbi:MAG: hypothetical protein CMK59_10125 [Proteobacteria bacterium]|nr:hypothetical protein [Pseudomonadota bacterium]